jgi:hypothetical protein
MVLSDSGMHDLLVDLPLNVMRGYALPGGDCFITWEARMPMSNVKYRVVLEPEVRAELEAMTRKTSAGVTRVRRAKILLMADENHADGGYPDWEIADEVKICERQVVRIRQKFVREGLKPTLTREVRSDAGTQKVIDGKAEAHLTAIACSTPPAGRDSWTLELLCDEMKRLKIVKSVCRETVRKSLKKTDCVPGHRSASASLKQIERGSSRGWRKSSTSTKKHSTNGVR